MVSESVVRGWLPMIVLCVCSSAASGQVFNVDLGTTYATPSASYGGAAGQPVSGTSSGSDSSLRSTTSEASLRPLART